MSGGICMLCKEPLADVSVMLDHLRIFHPDEYGDGPELWPDGSIVVVDQSDYTADEIGGAS